MPDAAAAVADKKKRTRSPAYPFINLETAIQRAKKFYDIEQHHAANLKVAVKHWDYEEKSSGGLQTAATLVAFGLMKDEGMGDKRKLQLTPLALRIILSPDPNERQEAIKRAALAPKIHQQLWKRWGAKPPSEASLKYTLLTEWEPRFNPNAVEGFIKEYKDTIAFAKLGESDKVSLEVEDSGGEGEAEYVPRVGDYVQWESQGILQFESRRLRDISPDGKFGFVDGQYAGLPIEQLSRATAPPNSPNPPDPATLTDRIPLSQKAQMQEFVVPLSAGSRAVFQWPTVLRKEDVDDLKDSLKILERKIARSIASTEEQAKTDQ